MWQITEYILCIHISCSVFKGWYEDKSSLGVFRFWADQWMYCFYNYVYFLFLFEGTFYSKEVLWFSTL